MSERHEDDDNWGFGGTSLVLILTTNKGSTITSGVKRSLLGGVISWCYGSYGLKDDHDELMWVRWFVVGPQQGTVASSVSEPSF